MRETTEIERAAAEIIAESPPDTWAWCDDDGTGDLTGYNGADDLTTVCVRGPDWSEDPNEIHEHGRAVGRWEIAVRLRAALRAASLK